MKIRDKFLLTCKTPILLYGASFQRGYYVKRKLEAMACNVVSFIDRQAPTLEKLDETPIQTLEEFVAKEYNVSQFVVIITTSNRFTQEEIVTTLEKKGFMYILFHQDDRDTAEAKQMARIYNELLDLMVDQPRVLNQEIFPVSQLREQKGTPYIVYNEERDMVDTYVPAELLFTMKESCFLRFSIAPPKQFKMFINKNICFSAVFNSMYDIVLHGIDGGFDKTKKEMEVYRDCISEVTPYPIKDEKFSRDLQVRYDIIQKMEQKITLDPLFFKENPAEVVWNENAYYNIEDGHNRVCFLMTKGIYLMPCRMRVQDFQQWLHLESYAKVKEYLEENQITSFDYPIAHPCFLKKESDEEFFTHKKISHLAKWLFETGYEPKEMDVLDINSKTGFYSQFFAKMGSQVTSLEKDPIFFELQGLLNDLLYVPQINLLEKSLSDLPENTTFDLTIAHRSLFAGGDLSHLGELNRLTKRLMLVDLDARFEQEIEIIEKSDFKHCTILKILPLYQRVFKICLFSK